MSLNAHVDKYVKDSEREEVVYDWRWHSCDVDEKLV